MAKRKTTKKDRQELKCRYLVRALVSTCAPGTIQRLLSYEYEYLEGSSLTEAEVQFWHKCKQSSMNLSSGMNKWAHDMLDELEEGEESETEGG